MLKNVLKVTWFVYTQWIVYCNELECIYSTVVHYFWPVAIKINTCLLFCPFISPYMKRTTADSEREEVKILVDKVWKLISISVHLLIHSQFSTWRITVKVMCSCRRSVIRWTVSLRRCLFASNNKINSRHLLPNPQTSPIPLCPHKSLTRKQWHHREEKAILNQVNRWTEKRGELILTYTETYKMY